MRKIFKKISAIVASTLMVGATVGVAAAANYPQPFITVGGDADVAIVYGTGSGVSPQDLVSAANIQTNLQSKMAGTDGSTTVVGGDNWQVGTSSDDLEINEAIADVVTYIGNDDLSLLADGSISNEKGEATYEQFFYFDDQESSAVNFTKDDDDNMGLFFKIKNGQQIARYVMSFNNNLKSDIESDMELSDIEDKSITFLGKTYTITDATNGTSGVELTLMSGALGGTVAEGTPLTVNGYTVSATVSSSTQAQFTITSSSGTETTDKMAKGDVEKLADGNYFAVTDITYEGYAEGDQSATFYVGADKIEWKNGNAMTVNGETISDSDVNITSTQVSGDISISEIAINMTAEDDLYVPEGGRLSEATNLNEPEVLVSQNWDIQFAGLESVEYEDISLKVSGSDQKYTLEWLNYNGDKVSLPLTFSNASGIFGGVDTTTAFVLTANGTGAPNITDKDYFLLNTADPTDSTSNAKTVLLQYRGGDKQTDSTKSKITLRINPGGDGEYTETITSSSSTTGNFVLTVAGATFTIINTTTADNNDFGIALSGQSYSNPVNVGGNVSLSAYIRTYYNTFINVTDTNVSLLEYEAGEACSATTACLPSAPWIINVTADDTNRDGDDQPLPKQIFAVTLGNTSTDTSATVNCTTGWVSDPDESTIQKFIGAYGYEVISTDPTDSPASIEAKVPKSVVKPLVYVTTAEGVTVTTSSGGSAQLGDILVKDSEVSNVQSKNLVVIGGSCINSVAAKLVGKVACGNDFTEETGISSGQFLIQSFGDAYTSGKIALLVAGYDMSDTVAAATYLRTQTVDTTAGKKYKGTASNSAELVVE